MYSFSTAASQLPQTYRLKIADIFHLQFSKVRSPGRVNWVLLCSGSHKLKSGIGWGYMAVSGDSGEHHFHAHSGVGNTRFLAVEPPAFITTWPLLSSRLAMEKISFALKSLSHFNPSHTSLSPGGA